MTYGLEITATYQRHFRKLPQKAQPGIRAKLDELCDSPFKAGLDVKKLSGREGYRLRVGDYRVIYLLDNNRLVVVALEVRHRKEIY